MADTTSKGLKRSFFQRILGIPATKGPQNDACWSWTDNKLVINLELAQELKQPGSAFRIEADFLPKRVLVFTDESGGIHAVCNECTHGRRRLDPVPGEELVQCCSVGKSMFTYDGKLVSGSAQSDLPTFPIELADNKLVIQIPQEDSA